MTNHETPEEVSGGLAGRLAGKAKQAAGAVLGDDALAREGRLQEASTDAERVAAREAADAREADAAADVERDRAEVAEERRRLQNEQAAAAQADAAERRAEQERLEGERDAARLVQQARQAEARADILDPKDQR
jgi:uncharacterized protein YjbJ (UPF0337 family)